MTFRVCHVITGLDVGGAETTLYRLLRASDRSRVPAGVVSLLAHGALAPAIRDLGVPVFDLGLARGRVDPRGIWRLWRRLRQLQPDLVQTWMYHADLLGAIAGAWLLGLPVVWNVRASDMDFSQYAPLSAWTVRECARLSRTPRAVVTNSASGVEHHASLGYRPREWVVIPNGVDLDEFHPDPGVRLAVRRELGLAEDAVVIGTAARLDPMKGHETLLAAARELLARDARIHLVLAGSGVTEGALGLEPGGPYASLNGRVRVLGYRADVARVMNAWDIAVSASTSEGFSNAVAEAMACGIPCVVTDVGESSRIVGETGVVVPPRRPSELAAACAHLARIGPDARRRMGEAARARVRETFGLERMVAAYGSLHERIVTDARRREPPTGT